MHPKSLVASVNVKLFYERVTASRLTCIFLAVALLHCVLQVSFQAWAFTINDRASKFLNDIVTTAGVGDDYALLVQGGDLRLCGPSDADKDIYQCDVAWQARNIIGGSGRNFSSDYEPVLTESTPVAPTLSTVVIAPAPAPPTTSTSTRSRQIVTAVPDDEDGDDSLSNEGVSKAEPGSPTGAPSAPSAIPSLSASAGAASRKRSLVEPIIDDEGVISGVVIPSMQNTTGPGSVTLSLRCAQMIVWPNQIIHNTKREDVTFMAFQCWVLMMSIVAILNESIPHIIAALLTHVLATGWSAYQFFGTASFRREFVRTTINSGRCSGVNLLPGYWQERHAAEIAVVSINAVSLVVTTFLSWRLVKMFGWQTFKRIGASLVINRVYKIVLIFSIALQIAFFFVIALMGLWLDFLINTPLGRRADMISMYKILAVGTCLLMFPWLALGWFAVRREIKAWMLTFLGVCLLLLGGWGALFMCRTFLWTFMDWRFFGVITIASSVLMLIATVLGVVCFFNFGKGLARFLLGQEPLSDDTASTRQKGRIGDVEKNASTVGFPDSGPIPTYSLAFGVSGPGAPPPSYKPQETLNYIPEYQPSNINHHKAARLKNLPPRFQSLGNSMEALGMTRGDSTTSTDSSASGSNPFSLDRSSSIGSQRSAGTVTSNGPGRSYASAGSHHVPNITTKKLPSDPALAGKRGWAIE